MCSSFGSLLLMRETVSFGLRKRRKENSNETQWKKDRPAPSLYEEALGKA